MSRVIDSITFYERFEADILAGRKTITLRDASESAIRPGQRLPVSTLETGREFAELDILQVMPIGFDALDEAHARQENMSLAELKVLIREIYPSIQTLYLIRFKLVK